MSFSPIYGIKQVLEKKFVSDTSGKKWFVFDQIMFFVGRKNKI